MTRTGVRPTFRQVMKGRGIKTLINGRVRAPISLIYTKGYGVNNPRYSQNRRYRTRDEIDRQRIRQEIEREGRQYTKLCLNTKLYIRG